MKQTTTKQPTYRELVAHWEGIKADFVTSVWNASMRESWIGARFAYVKPSSVGEWGVLAHFTEDQDVPEGFELVTPERITLGTKQDISRWLERYAGRLPVYPQ